MKIPRFSRNSYFYRFLEIPTWRKWALVFLQVPKKRVFKLLSLKFFLQLNSNSTFKALTLFRLGLFGAAHGWGTVFGKKVPLPKIYYTYPVTIKLGIVIPYLKKIQKTCESRDTPLSSADISIFHWKSANFATSRKTDISWILIHNF